MLAAIMSGVSDQYDMQRQILDNESRVTRSRVETVIQQRFERLEAEKEHSGTVALATTPRDTRAVLCQLCSKPGHLVRQCKRNKTQFKISGCATCGKKNHKTEDCWGKDRNKPSMKRTTTAFQESATSAARADTRLGPARTRTMTTMQHQTEHHCHCSYSDKT